MSAAARGGGPVTRARGRLAAVAAALALCAAAAGCALEPAEPANPGPAATPPGTTAAPAPEPSAEPWERYSDPRFPQSFELPPGWSVREAASHASAELPIQLELLDGSGARQLTLATGVQGMGAPAASFPSSPSRSSTARPSTSRGTRPPRPARSPARSSSRAWCTAPRSSATGS